MKITAAVVSEQNGPFVLQEWELGEPATTTSSWRWRHPGSARPCAPRSTVSHPAVSAAWPEPRRSARCFLPRLIDLWRRGELRVDRFMTHYDVDDVDAKSGAGVKPVLRMH